MFTLSLPSHTQVYKRQHFETHVYRLSFSRSQCVWPMPSPLLLHLYQSMFHSLQHLISSDLKKKIVLTTKGAGITILLDNSFYSSKDMFLAILSPLVGVSSLID